MREQDSIRSIKGIGEKQKSFSQNWGLPQWEIFCGIIPEIMMNIKNRYLYRRQKRERKQPFWGGLQEE